MESNGHATESLQDSLAPKERARLPIAVRRSPVGKQKIEEGWIKIRYLPYSWLEIVF